MYFITSLNLIKFLGAGKKFINDDDDDDWMHDDWMNKKQTNKVFKDVPIQNIVKPKGI